MEIINAVLKGKKRQ